MDYDDGPSWSIERGVLDTFPFHERYRQACEEGSLQEIEAARSAAREAGISFSQDADASASLAWVGKPSITYVLRILGQLDRKI